MSNDKNSIIAAVIGSIGAIGVAYLSYLAVRDGILIPLNATQTAEAKLTLIAPAPGPTYGGPYIPNKASNLVERFDFENGLPPNTSLGVCDDTLTWYDVCHEAPGRFGMASGGFMSEKSLKIQIEILPGKAQVYSLRLPVSHPGYVDGYVDAVNANVYISQANRFSKITLAARVKDKNIWIFSDIKPTKEGWLHFLVDLQGYKNDASISNGEISIDEIHIDMFIVKGGQNWGDEYVLIDDVELYYPLPKPVKTTP